MFLVTRGVRTLAVAVTASSALLTQAATGAPTQATPSAGSPPSTAAASASETAALPRLRGTVGPDSTITISPRRVVKGRYRQVVKDESSAHNWHITGPGIDRSTSVSGTGRSVWRVRLRRGTYNIVCDVHPITMNTSLRVTAG